MRALLRAELVKLATTRTAIGLVAGGAAVAALGAVSTIMSGQPAELHRPLPEQTFFLLASINLSLFAVVLGIRGFTDEFRHGLIVPTLLVTPSRVRVVAAKTILVAAAGAALAAVAQVVMLAVAIPLLQGKGVEPTLEPADLAAMGGLIAASALWASIGVAVGAIVRHQVAAVVGALLWVLLVENLGAGALGEASRYLPGQAGHGLATASQAGTLLAPAVGALVLGAYALLAVAVAAVRLTRSDITTA
jgi:ABC-type transport system involved in multi-copper enzyme maturation permease subunit